MSLNLFETALFLPNYLFEIWHGCCGKNFLILVCVKIPVKNLEQLSWVAFSKLFSTVELCLLAWKVGFAENQTSSSLLNQLNVSWVEILTPRVRTTVANFAECVYFFFSVIFYLLSLYWTAAFFLTCILCRQLISGLILSSSVTFDTNWAN